MDTMEDMVMSIQKQHKKEQKVEGLKMMRANRYASVPEHECENCRCKRYSPCCCIKAKE